MVILEMIIEPGSTLYLCGQPGAAGRPYVRHHSSTEVASRAEILAISHRQGQGSIPVWRPF